MAKQSIFPGYNKENHELPYEEALKLAKEHHHAGNLVIAERTYKDILNTLPNNPTVNHLLGALYYQLSLADLAIKYMQRSLDINPNEIQYQSNLAIALAMAGRYEEALELLDKVIANDNKNVEALDRRADTLWNLKRYKEAEQTARKSLELLPNNLDSIHVLAISLSSQNRFSEANELWKKAAELYPEEANVWSNWANMLKEQGTNLALALEKAEKAIELAPDSFDAQNNMGAILKQLGRSDEAIEYFTKATDIKPDFATAHYNKALACGDSGRFKECIVAAKYAIAFKPDYAEAYNILSSAYIETADFKNAHFTAQRAIQYNENSVDAYINLASVLYILNRYEDGHAALKKALELEPNNEISHAKLADTYEKLSEFELAIESIDNAIEIAPHNSKLLIKKGSLLHMLNRVEDALEYADKAIEIAPNMLNHHMAKVEWLISAGDKEKALKTLQAAGENLDKRNPLYCYSLTNLKRFEDENDPDFELLLEVAENIENYGALAGSSLLFGIAKAYEQVKNYDQAFEYYKKANDLKRSILPFSDKDIRGPHVSVRKVWTPEYLEELKGHGCESDLPIFIVGMPRSGTTLTEQIISSHPEVYGAGELAELGASHRRGGRATPENIAGIGQYYIDQIKPLDKSGTARFITDKMPANFFNIGLIASALQNAKIIHCCRNPFDTCLSNYKQTFMVGQHWSYNMEELGKEYLYYLETMKYWNQVLPGRIYEINYEETVTNLEDQARKLIDFIGLEWNDACLEPHKQERAVLTASKSQVRRPVYTSSIERWKRYEKQFQPLVKTIEAGLSEKDLAYLS